MAAYSARHRTAVFVAVCAAFLVFGGGEVRGAQPDEASPPNRLTRKGVVVDFEARPVG